MMICIDIYKERAKGIKRVGKMKVLGEQGGPVHGE